MLYYKVNKEHSQKQFGTKRTKMYYVKNELFTEYECKKYNVNKEFCTPIHVSKKQTHWCFGARFMNAGAHYHTALLDFNNF